MDDTGRQILRSAETITDQAGREVRTLRQKAAAAIAEEGNRSLRDVYLTALEMGIWPRRFLRNASSISHAEQLTLMRSCVSVAGAGGLGGNVILFLLRLGLGSIIVIDHDRFDETNLNRQPLCREEAMGRFKAEEALREAASVNSATVIVPRIERLKEENATELLRGSSIAVDALDTVEARFILENGAKAIGIPFVHGAVAGFEGQLMTVFPQDRGLCLIYGGIEGRRKGRPAPEHELGVPAPTAAALADLQVMEVLKVLLNKGTPIRNAMLHVDLLSGEFARFLF